MSSPASDRRSAEVRARARRALLPLAAVVSACAAAPRPAPALTLEPAPAPEHAPSVMATAPPSAQLQIRPEGPAAGPVSVTWSDVHSTADCFFFSGPGALGRDTHLSEQGVFAVHGDQVELSFGPDAVFRGRFTPPHADAVRRGRYDFGGPWSTEERFAGALAGPRVFEGDYQYKECELAHPDQCPGPCTIRAHVTFRW
jgi:hypothetical protein